MKNRTTRFLPPLIVSITGFAFAVYIIVSILTSVRTVIGSEGISFDMIRVIQGDLGDEVYGLIFYIVPLLILEYFVLGIPIAGLLLIITILVRSLSYEVVILDLGESFGSFRMLKRAMVPALFAFSLGGIISELLRNVIFNEVPAMSPEQLALLYQPISAIIVTLLALPISLALYSSTWILNDAGVITQLKERKMRSRRCPDTIGIGRWWSNLLGGFTLLITPLMSFYYHIYVPVFIYGHVMNSLFIGRAIFLSIGLPFVALAFVLPIVIVNEIFVRKTTPIIRKIARSFGAKFATPEAEMEALI